MSLRRGDEVDIHTPRGGGASDMLREVDSRRDSAHESLLCRFMKLSPPCRISR